MTAASGFSEESGKELESLMAHAVLGSGLPKEAERHLYQAGQAYHLDDVAEAHLREAHALAPDHAAVLIGLYRFYFYKGRLKDALVVAELCLQTAARACNFGTDWRLVTPSDADFRSWDALWPRFFLFTLKGYAYLKMRLGCLSEGRQAIEKLLALDPADKIGAGVLAEILNRAEEDDVV